MPVKYDDFDLTIYDNADICYMETTEPTMDQINYKFTSQHPQWK